MNRSAMLEFEVDEGLKELQNSMERAVKKFPASAERALQNETEKIASDMKSWVPKKIKGHGRIGTEKPGKRLENRFKPGKVIRKGLNYTAADLSGAPHYHLVEEGHDLYTHLRKNKRGKGKVGSNRKIGHVDGKKIVAGYMAERSRYSELIAGEMLDEILKEAGF